MWIAKPTKPIAGIPDDINITIPSVELPIVIEPPSTFDNIAYVLDKEF